MCAAIPRAAAQEITAVRSLSLSLRKIIASHLTVGGVNVSANAANGTEIRQKGRRLFKMSSRRTVCAFNRFVLWDTHNAFW